MTTTILYGNGLNRLSNAPSWDNILSQLDSSWSAKRISSWYVPNTIQYDELLLQSRKSDSNILQHLCVIANAKYDNEIYQNLANRKNVNFITTNYDFSLELSINNQFFINPQNNQSVWEKLYNVNTYYMPSNNAKIWHIHGDVLRPQSIILGYDHYCKQIAKIEKNLPANYLLKPTKGYTRSKHEDVLDTWATNFFTDDIYILGLGLGFEELDLWWLIDKWSNYRKKTGNMINRIVYLDTDISESKKTLQELQYKRNFITVLSDFGIEYQLYIANSRLEAYIECLNVIP